MTSTRAARQTEGGAMDAKLQVARHRRNRGLQADHAGVVSGEGAGAVRAAGSGTRHGHEGEGLLRSPKAPAWPTLP